MAAEALDLADLFEVEDDLFDNEEDKKAAWMDSNDDALDFDELETPRAAKEFCEDEEADEENYAGSLYEGEFPPAPDSKHWKAHGFDKIPLAFYDFSRFWLWDHSKGGNTIQSGVSG